MARQPEGIEVGIHLLGLNSNTGVMVLFGGNAPGGQGDFDDIAEIGSVYIRTDGSFLQKKANGGSTSDWERKADRSELYDQAEIDALLAPKVNYSDIVANIVTNDDNVPLSASQAIVLTNNLNTAITNLKGGVSTANDTLKKLEDNANTFRSRTDNPHMVTKAQVGLSVVENKTSQDIRDEITDADIPDNITRDGEADSKIAVAINNLKGNVGGNYDTLEEIEDEVEAHKNRTDNPHAVTKAQVGLSVVENKTSQDIRDEIVDSDIPSTIARDTEVTTAVNNAITLIRGGVPVDGDNLNKLNNKINSILQTLQSDETALDTLQEVVDFIENNRADLDAVLTNKINYTDIVDDLLSTDGSTKVLSANQGRVLRLLVEARAERANNLSDLNDIPTARTNLSVYSKAEVDSALALKEDILSNSEIKTRYEANANTNAFTDIEKSKLAGIEDNATADQTDVEIETLYEGRPNTNKFTDALLAKLNGIEAGATGDQTATEIETLYEGLANTNKYTDVEKSKLGGIEDNATQNETDAYLLNRANHTNTQPASTISDFDVEVENNTQVAQNTTHRGRTDNPHAVTKAQVGLGNVPNIDATQRANHTGVQLAQTITQLNALLGIGNAGNTYAFQMNPAGDGYVAKLIFEREADRTTPLGHNQTFYAQMLRLTVDLPETGDYIIDWGFQWSYNDTGSNFLARIQLDDSSDVVAYSIEPADSGGAGINVSLATGGTDNTGTDQRVYTSGSKTVKGLSAGSHNFDLDIASQSGGVVGCIYQAEIRIRKAVW